MMALFEIPFAAGLERPFALPLVVGRKPFGFGTRPDEVCGCFAAWGGLLYHIAKASDRQLNLIKFNYIYEIRCEAMYDGESLSASLGGDRLITLALSINSTDVNYSF